jgi:uncharacterized protein (DUF1015 family)
MASIAPFRAVLYAAEPSGDITPLVAPPYDVIDGPLRARLAVEPHNVVAIDLPEGSADPSAPDSRYTHAGELWRNWIEKSVLVTDETPAVYLLEQSWVHVGRAVTRRAFIGAVRLHDFDECVVLPHERTLPKAIDDRLNLTRACAANLSPVFGMYSDPDGATDELFEAAHGQPILFEARDADGVVSRVHALRDPEDIAALQALLEPLQVFIADGHHRYTTALAYRDERRALAGAAADPNTDYEFTMMALVNMDDPGLIVLPPHRLARAEGTFDAPAFWAELAGHFQLTVGGPDDLPDDDRPTFFIKTSDGTTRIARLRTELDAADLIEAPASSAWKRLDVAVAQELILRPLLDIRVEDRTTLERLSFAKETGAALAMPGGADVAIIMRATRMDQLRAVALGGEVMPQKTTYFYPKLITGLLFRSLD